MNKLDHERQSQIVRCLVDGNSIRATCRITGASKNTVTKLLVRLGTASAEYQRKHVVNLTPRRVQIAEIWCFCHTKESNLPPNLRGMPGIGDIWTWIALDADTKLAITWLVGKRDGSCAAALMTDLSERITTRIQMTTDGLRLYVGAVRNAFGSEID